MRAGKAFASGASHVIGVGLQALLVVAIIATLAFAAAAATNSAPAGANSVFAAKGGNGNGNGGGGGGGGGAVVAGSSISVNGSDQGLVLGSSITFATNVVGLTGNEYALIYLQCVQSGTTVYGQLDLPNTTFVLGGGSSPWWQVGGTASCVGYLQAYGSHGGLDTIRTLAQTPSFSAN